MTSIIVVRSKRTGFSIMWLVECKLWKTAMERLFQFPAELPQRYVSQQHVVTINETLIGELASRAASVMLQRDGKWTEL